MASQQDVSSSTEIQSPSTSDSILEASITSLAVMSTSHQGSSTTHVVYSRRWLMLAAVVLLNFSNAVNWICYASVADKTNAFYCADGQQCSVADWLSLVFMIVAVPVGFLAMYSVDKYGLKSAIYLSGLLNLVGSLIRVVSALELGQASGLKVGLVLGGQAIAACAQPFMMYLPTKLAALWFPENQRALANAIGSMSNPLGILAAMASSPLYVHSTKDIIFLNCATTVPAIAAVVVSMVGVRSSLPPSPPSRGAAETPLSFWLGIQRLLRTPSYLILVLTLGGGIGLFNSIYTLLEQILCSRGYSDQYAGMCGALLILLGFFGALAAGAFVDRTRLFEETTKVCFCVAAIFACAFAVATMLTNSSIFILVFIAIFGMFGFAFYPIGLELGVECTHPAAEASSSGLIIISGQIQGIIYVFAMSALAPNSGSSTGGCSAMESIDWTFATLFWAAAVAFHAVLTTVLFWPHLRRSAKERAE